MKAEKEPTLTLEESELNDFLKNNYDHLIVLALEVTKVKLADGD